MSLTLAFIRRPRVQALVDGMISIPGVDLSVAVSYPSNVRHRMIRAGDLDGGEMSTSGLFRARLRGERLVALPVFIKRGFNHQHIVCREDAPYSDLADLSGKRVGVVHADSSVMVWLRGVLTEEYGVLPADVRWVTPDAGQAGFASGSRVEEVQLPAVVENPGFLGRERLDDMDRPLTSAEVFMLRLLVEGSIDAFCCNTYATGPGIRPVLRDGDMVEAAYYRRTRVYPINHTVVLQERLVRQRPEIAQWVISALRQARDRADQWLSPAGKMFLARERVKLAGYDPFAYELADEELHTLRTFQRYQIEQGLLAGPFPVEDLFGPTSESIASGVPTP